MIVEFEITLAQQMALVNAMAWYEGDNYVDFSTRSYGFYYDEQGVERHGYYSHAPRLINCAGNAITCEDGVMYYNGSRNAPWSSGNSINHCFHAAGIFNYGNTVAEEYRHVLPMASKMPNEEWWRHSYYNYYHDKVVNTYSVATDAPALPYDEHPDEAYRAI